MYYVPYGDSGTTTSKGKLYLQYTQYRRLLASRNVIVLRDRKRKSVPDSTEPHKQLDMNVSESLALAILKTEIDVNDERVPNFISTRLLQIGKLSKLIL